MLLTNAVNAPHLAMLGAFLESPPSYPPVKFLTNGGTLEENSAMGLMGFNHGLH